MLIFMMTIGADVQSSYRRLSAPAALDSMYLQAQRLVSAGGRICDLPTHTHTESRTRRATRCEGIGRTGSGSVFCRLVFANGEQAN